MAAKAAVGEADKKLSRSDKALARQLCEWMADSLLPGEAALPEGRLVEAAEFLLEAALLRKEGEPAILMRTAASGRRFMRIAWWYLLAPASTLALLMLSLNFLSDVLSEMLDPTRRGKG